MLSTNHPFLKFSNFLSHDIRPFLAVKPFGVALPYQRCGQSIASANQRPEAIHRKNNQKTKENGLNMKNKTQFAKYLQYFSSILTHFLMMLYLKKTFFLFFPAPFFPRISLFLCFFEIVFVFLSFSVFSAFTLWPRLAVAKLHHEQTSTRAVDSTWKQCQSCTTNIWTFQWMLER